MSEPSASLVTDPNVTDPDALFELLVQAHAGLSTETSAALDARLVLVLANHVGDLDVVRAAIALARRAVPGQASQAG